MNIFDEFDFSPMKIHVVWLIIIYGAVVFAMVVDLICGVYKARKAGIARTSTGYKKTCAKAIKYFFPMLCLTCIDFISCMIVPMPVFTAVMGAFIIFCEWRSVMEKTHEKAEMRKAEKTMSIILENKDDLAKALAKLLADHSIANAATETTEIAEITETTLTTD